MEYHPDCDRGQRVQMIEGTAAARTPMASPSCGPHSGATNRSYFGKRNAARQFQRGRLRQVPVHERALARGPLSVPTPQKGLPVESQPRIPMTIYRAVDSILLLAPPPSCKHPTSSKQDASKL